MTESETLTTEALLRAIGDLKRADHRLYLRHLVAEAAVAYVNAPDLLRPRAHDRLVDAVREWEAS